MKQKTRPLSFLIFLSLMLFAETNTSGTVFYNYTRDLNEKGFIVKWTDFKGQEMYIFGVRQSIRIHLFIIGTKRKTLGQISPEMMFFWGWGG